MNTLYLSLWAFIVLLGITIYYRYSVRYFKIWEQLRVNGPKPWPLFGTTLRLLRMGVAKHDWELIRRYGRVVGTFEGRFPVLLIADEEIIKSVLIKNFANFTDRRSSDLDPFPVNKTLAKLRGQRWKAVRSMLAPSFSTAKIKNMMPVINRCASIMTDNLRRDPANVIFKECCGSYALDVIARALLGLDLDPQSDPDDGFVRHARRIFSNRPMNATALLLFAMPFLMPVFRLFGLRLSLLPVDSVDFFVQTINRTVDLRLKDKQSHSDFLQHLLDSADFTSDHDNIESATGSDRPSEGSNSTGTINCLSLSREEVVAQAFMFLIAGYETTATAASLLAYSLARHPDCQKKLHEEIDLNSSEGDVSCDDLSRLPYLQMCVDESLRLYPPAFRVDRFCSRETTVGCLRIPQGCIVTIPVYSVNRDPDYWPEPDKFIPDRFSTSEKLRRSPTGSSLSFGLGPRSCIGRRLALVEVKVLFVQILRVFSIHLSSESPAQEPEFEKGVLLQLKRPLRLTLKPRTASYSSYTSPADPETKDWTQWADQF